MTKAEKKYNILRHYGRMVASRDHKTVDGHIITFKTYWHEGIYYVVSMFDGQIISVGEREEM